MTRIIPWLCAGLLTFAACGGSSDDPGVASLQGDNAAADSDDDGDDEEEATPEETEAAFREFAECMREHGVDMPDPEITGDGPGGDGGVMLRVGPEGGGEVSGPSDIDMEKMDAAHEACQPLIDGVVRGGPGDLDPEQEAEMRDRALDFAQCMRDNGVDFPDPQFEGGGRMTQSLSDVDPTSDEFQAAQEACAEEMGGEAPFIAGAPIESTEDK